MSNTRNSQACSMTIHEEFSDFAVYNDQEFPLLGEGHFEFNQELQTEHGSKESLQAEWEKEYSRFTNVLAASNGISSPSKGTQDLINKTVKDFCQWGFQFARYGKHLGWKPTTAYLDLATGFAALKENVYTDPSGDRDLLKQHLEKLQTLRRVHFPDGDPDDPRNREEDDRGRKPVIRRTGS
ncbi:MAG: hypothetical protein Q9195_001224 [Heterodermia aff. obscurata]